MNCERCHKERNNFETWIGLGMIDGYESLCQNCFQVIHALREATTGELGEELDRRKRGTSHAEKQGLRPGLQAQGSAEHR